MILEAEHYKKIDHEKYKYELIEECYYIDPIFEKYTCYHEYFKIIMGCTTVKVGYRWDGPSGPTIDDDTNMRGALFHDVFYQAIREGLLPKNWKTRRIADKIFLKILKEDGMPWYRRTAYFYSVRGAGMFFAYF